MTTRRWVAIGAVTLAGLACGADKTECGPGTRLEGGACVAACGEGTVPEPGTGRCIAACGPGTFLDPSTGDCLPDFVRCGGDELWDPTTGRCVSSTELCEQGSTWVSGEARCVPDAELRTPAYFEGTAYNDMDSNPPACERFPLPAPGAAPTSFGGRIDAPELAMGVFGPVQIPDMDCWAFEVDGPTLLRLAVDGLGGAAPGVKVVNLDGAWFLDRLGLARQDQTLHREVYLSKAGTYAIVVSDAFNLTNAQGVYRGGGALGYHARVGTRPLPEPIPLRTDGGAVAARGVFSTGAPDEDSAIRLFSVTGATDQLFELDLRTGGRATAVFAGTAGNGVVFDAGVNDVVAWPLAFGAPGTSVFAVDYDRSLDFEDVPWELTVEPQPLRVLDGPSAVFTVDQRAFTHDQQNHWHYVGFRADVGEIAILRVGSSTGFTCAQIWNEAFDALDADAQCFLGNVPAPELELRFHPTYDGLYILKTFDWSEAFVDGNVVLSVPRRQYELALTLHRERPVELGDLSEPWSSREAVTEERWERFFSLAPRAGDAFWFETEAELPFEPVLASYWIDPERWVHNLVALWHTTERRFAYRSVTAEPMVLGISDGDRAAGSFDFRAEKIEVIDAGEVADGAPLESSHVLDAGDERRFLRVDLARPGLFDLTLRSSAADVWAVPLAPDFTELTSLGQRTEGPSGAVRIRRPLAGPLFLELLPVDGEALASETAITVEATLAAYDPEEEDNDVPADAQPLAIPSSIAADRTPGDETDWDWYAIDVTGPTVIDVVTRPLVMGGLTFAYFVIFPGSGPCEGFTCRRTPAESEGDGVHAIRNHSLPTAGRYLIRVEPYGSETDYLLEVRHAEP